MRAMQKNPRDRYCSAAEFLLDIEDLRRNPNMKFDYGTYFVDSEPTRFVNKVPSDESTQVIKTVPPSADARMKLDEVNVKTVDAVQDIRPAKHTNTKVVGVVAGIAVAVIIFIGILLFSVLKDGVDVPTLFTGKKIEVDNFIGMNYLDEIKDNEDYKERFNFEISYEPFSDGKAGCVFKQDPEAGTEVPKGYTIRLYVAKSGEGQILPDLEGDNYQEAINTLESMGFVVIAEPVEDENVPIGKVIKTKPAAGSSVFEGSDVTVYYSADESSGKLFKMPDVSGKTLSEAKKILQKSGLNLSKTEVVDSSVEKDRVVMQSPAEGSPVQEGDSVILTVSSGQVFLKKNIDLPTKVGKVNVKLYVDDKMIADNNVDTDVLSKYTIETSGDSAAASIKLYINDKLYYESTANFTKEPVSVTRERYYTISFYVDVVGLDKETARAELNKAGYNNISFIEIPGSEPAGTVVAQTPSTSTSPNLDKTSAITLYIAASQESTQQPDTQENTDNIQVQ